MEAARGQASLYRYERALEMVERGRDIAKGSKDEFALTSLHGQYLTDAGMVAESLAAYRRALDLAADDVDRCNSWIGIAHGLRLSDESTDALAILEKAEPVAVQHDLTVDLALPRVSGWSSRWWWRCLGRMMSRMRPAAESISTARCVRAARPRSGGAGSYGLQIQYFGLQ